MIDTFKQIVKTHTQRSCFNIQNELHNKLQLTSIPSGDTFLDPLVYILEMNHVHLILFVVTYRKGKESNKTNKIQTGVNHILNGTQ